MRENKYKTVGSWLRILLVIFTVFAAIKIASAQQESKPLDPKAWGSNNVGKGVPEFIHGDECLFCHRTNIGLNWVKNSHAKALRQIEDAPDLENLLKLPELAAVKDITYFLGSRNHIRFLKKDGYGKFAMLEAHAVFDKDRKATINPKNLNWDKEKFASQCVGCHTCHGAPSIDHTNDTSLMILSKKRRNEAQIITSLCAQCHLRGGKSKSTGLPYPNTFVAGDNLFQDYEIDWKKADDEKLDPLERHIFRNVRDVAVDGKTSTTCISCHQVHYDTKEKSVMKHQGVPQSKLCSDCHLGETPTKAVKKFVRTSKVCEY
jgi:nitrate/TMAO reductase-like tetraheme cytochrome c subunit